VEKHYNEASTELKQLIAAYPDDPEVLHPVAILALQQNDLVTAEREMRHLLDLNYVDNGLVRYYLGQIAEETSRYDEARKWYSQVVVGEHYINARSRLANLFARDNHFEEARKVLHDSVAHTVQDRTQLVLAESRLLKQAQRQQEAFDLLENALDKQPSQPDLLYDSAMLAERLRRYDILETRLRKLIQLQPDNPQPYNALGFSFAERNQKLNEAKQLIEEALKRSPEDPYILDSMGWVLYRLKDFPGALDYLQRAYRQQADGEIAAHLGEVLWSLDRRDDALHTWRDAAKSNPDNEVLRDVIQRFAH
jgi:Flp pilus assembly protein TadD